MTADAAQLRDRRSAQRTNSGLIYLSSIVVGLATFFYTWTATTNVNSLLLSSILTGVATALCLTFILEGL